MQADLLLENAVTRIEGPLLFARREARVGLNAAVEVLAGNGPPRLGRVAALDETSMVIEVLEATSGLALRGTRIRLHPEPLLFGVGPNLHGRVFNSVGFSRLGLAHAGPGRSPGSEPIRVPAPTAGARSRGAIRLGAHHPGPRRAARPV